MVLGVVAAPSSDHLTSAPARQGMSRRWSRTLSRMRHSGSTALAVALDVAAWSRGSAPGQDPVAWLASHGWRAVAAGPRDPVASVWQDLGVVGGSRSTARDGRTEPVG